MATILSGKTVHDTNRSKEPPIHVGAENISTGATEMDGEASRV